MPMTSRMPFLRSVRSVTSEMPVIFLLCTPSLIFSMTFSGPTRYGQLGDDQCGLTGGDLLDRDLRASLERAAAGGVGIPDAVEPDDRATRRKIRPGNVRHEVIESRGRILEKVLRRGGHLDEVVRRHVGRHPDGDAGSAVHEQVRVRGRQHLGLGQLVVVVRHEVDDILIESFAHRDRRGLHARLGVPRGGRPVVERPEVAVPVDERHAHREVLREAHEGVVDGCVAVRVQAPHHVADDA